MKAISYLVHTSVQDMQSSLWHATREEIIAAHRWCERQGGGHKTRKRLLAAALRKLEKEEAR